MNYLVIEMMGVNPVNHIGPFPSQCQAYSWAESREGKSPFTFRVTPILTPDFMPTLIHGKD